MALDGVSLYVGIDEGQTEFEVCVVAEDATAQERRSFLYDGAAIAQMCSWLRSLAGDEPARVAAALERPHGAVVAGLLDAGFGVFSINPKQVNRFRDRFSVAGAKDDRFDARVLGHSLRTDSWLFRRLSAEAGWLVMMRELSRLEDELKEERRRTANRLRAVLHEYHAQMFYLLPSADEPWLWALVKLGPTPQKAARLRPQQVDAVLKKHRIRRFDANDVVELLRRDPLPVAPGVIEANSTRAVMLAERLTLIERQLRESQQGNQKLLDELGGEEVPGQTSEHRDLQIIQSLPGAGRYVVVTMLAEAWEPLKSRDYDILRALSGVAPVTKQSGRSHVVQMRLACNHRVRNAVYFWAWTASRLDPRLQCLYQGMRHKGHSHARALRGVADRLLKLLTVLLATNACYDPLLRKAAA